MSPVQEDFPEPPDWCGYHISAYSITVLPILSYKFYFRDQCPQWDGDFLPFSPPLHHAACGIIVPQPGIEPRPLGSEGTCNIVCAQWVFVLKQETQLYQITVQMSTSCQKASYLSETAAWKTCGHSSSGRKDGSFDLWLIDWLLFCHSKSGERCHLVVDLRAAWTWAL